MPILIYLLFWVVRGMQPVNPWSAWFIGLILATVLTIYGFGHARRP